MKNNIGTEHRACVLEGTPGCQTCSFQHSLLRGHKEEVSGGLVRPAMIELQCQNNKTRWVETAAEAKAKAKEAKAENVDVTNLIDPGVQVQRHQR